MLEHELSETDYLLLKSEYSKAVKTDTRIFKFKGQDVLTGYVKYLLEHLEKTKQFKN